MAIAYSINGGSEIGGIISTWQRVVKRQNADGTIDYADYAINLWSAPMMTVANYAALQALLSTSLTSLETNNVTARNSAATYTDVFLRNLSGNQSGLIMIDVLAEFEVNI